MEFDERRYRPLSTVDLFDEAFDLYKRNFVLFLAIVSFVVIPTTIFNDIFAMHWLNALLTQLSLAQSNIQGATITLGYLEEFMRQFIIAFAIYLPPYTLIFGALTAAVSARYHDQKIDLGQALIEGVRRWWWVLLATVYFVLLNVGSFAITWLGYFLPDLAGFFFAVGSLVGIILSIIVSLRYPLYIGAAVAEKIGPVKALKRSAALTATDAGRVAWTIFCMFVLSLCIWLAMFGVVQLLAGKIVDSAYLTVPVFADHQAVASDIAFGLVDLIMAPFTIIVMTMIYFDQRIRKEGYDMEILANRLGYPPVDIKAKVVYTPALTSRAKGRK